MSKEVDILRKYKAPVIKALNNLKKQRSISKICREYLNGMNPSRITEILSGRRELTPYYLRKFTGAGIVDLEQILDGKSFANLPEDDQVLFQRLVIDDETIRLLLAVKKKGIDIMQILRFLAYGK